MSVNLENDRSFEDTCHLIILLFFITSCLEVYLLSTCNAMISVKQPLRENEISVGRNRSTTSTRLKCKAI